MRKKIVFLAFCLILFLIFTALSYGEIDPKYDKLRGDPWSRLESPPIDQDENFDIVMVVINLSCYYIFRFQSKDVTYENPEKVVTSNHHSLNKNERKFQK